MLLAVGTDKETLCRIDLWYFVSVTDAKQPDEALILLSLCGWHFYPSSSHATAAIDAMSVVFDSLGFPRAGFLEAGGSDQTTRRMMNDSGCHNELLQDIASQRILCKESCLVFGLARWNRYPKG
uniref:Uncharacterized protein n=1 Tax=Entomoneis paludosa TaxID=265537 RepID=A0A7S2YLS4_9STRA|mmetsp:Transcript_38388/g.79811  ORF Transcript_38388/g.79811 Transcript_38388/m.79811 type:complete len:124 (+) Transcript_38388:205-576(+)